MIDNYEYLKDRLEICDEIIDILITSLDYVMQNEDLSETTKERIHKNISLAMKKQMHFAKEHRVDIMNESRKPNI